VIADGDAKRNDDGGHRNVCPRPCADVQYEQRRGTNNGSGTNNGNGTNNSDGNHGNSDFDPVVADPVVARRNIGGGTNNGDGNRGNSNFDPIVADPVIARRNIGGGMNNGSGMNIGLGSTNIGVGGTNNIGTSAGVGSTNIGGAINGGTINGGTNNNGGTGNGDGSTTPSWTAGFFSFFHNLHDELGDVRADQQANQNETMAGLGTHSVQNQEIHNETMAFIGIVSDDVRRLAEAQPSTFSRDAKVKIVGGRYKERYGTVTFDAGKTFVTVQLEGSPKKKSLGRANVQLDN